MEDERETAGEEDEVAWRGSEGGLGGFVAVESGEVGGTED